MLAQQQQQQCTLDFDLRCHGAIEIVLIIITTAITTKRLTTKKILALPLQRLQTAVHRRRIWRWWLDLRADSSRCSSKSSDHGGLCLLWRIPHPLHLPSMQRPPSLAFATTEAEWQMSADDFLRGNQTIRIQDFKKINHKKSTDCSFTQSQSSLAVKITASSWPMANSNRQQRS